MSKQRYMIKQDRIGQWYLLKLDDVELFDDLIECHISEITDEGDEWLNERMIDGPSYLNFIDPVCE